MFALIAAPRGGITDREIAAMGAAIRGTKRGVTTWRDENGRAAVAVGVSGILTEDEFDRQPLIDGDLAFVAQARIDNRDAILAELAVPRGRWASHADSDVLHLAYRRWAEDCVQHLAGDYAFAAWHRDDGRVVAAVDHIGSVRLCYAEHGGRLILSTQLGSLLAHPQAPRDLDLKALGLLAAPKVEEGSTPYKDVHALVGGHLLCYRSGTVEVRRWWRPDATVRTHYRDPRDYVLAAREIFDRAVTTCLRTSGSVSSLMSGGLDSTLVTATAAQKLKERGRAITAYLSVPAPGLASDARPGWDADDSPYATAVADMHDNLNLLKLAPGGLCTLEIVPQIHAVSHTPVRNGPNHIWTAAACSGARASGAQVMLHGGKGNATISQSGEGVLGDLFWRLRWSAAYRQANSRNPVAGQPPWRAIVREAIGARGREILRRVRGNPSQPERPGAVLFTPEFRAAQAPSLASFSRPVVTRGGQVDFMRMPARPWGADTMAQWGIEFRDPTADRPLIERLLSFPREAFSIDGRPRGLARSMGEDRVPDSVRFRQTRGEQLSEIASLIALNATKYRAALACAEGSARFRAIFDVERVRAMLHRICEGRAGQMEGHTIDRVVDIGLFIVGEGS